MIRTSYGVRFFVFAKPWSTLAQLSLKCAIWSATSFFAVVFGVNSYVAGKRKPSIPRACLRNAGGTFAAFDAAAYAFPESFGVTLRFVFAICRTSATRFTISLRVKPSGKTTRRITGFGAAAVVAGGGSSSVATAERVHAQPERERQETDQQRRGRRAPCGPPVSDVASLGPARPRQVALEQVRGSPRVLGRP